MDRRFTLFHPLNRPVPFQTQRSKFPDISCFLTDATPQATIHLPSLLNQGEQASSCVTSPSWLSASTRRTLPHAGRAGKTLSGLWGCFCERAGGVLRLCLLQGEEALASSVLSQDCAESGLLINRLSNVPGGRLRHVGRVGRRDPGDERREETACARRGWRGAPPLLPEVKQGLLLAPPLPLSLPHLHSPSPPPPSPHAPRDDPQRERERERERE